MWAVLLTGEQTVTTCRLCDVDCQPDDFIVYRCASQL